jgi:hypothetical protein
MSRTTRSLSCAGWADWGQIVSDVRAGFLRIGAFDVDPLDLFEEGFRVLAKSLRMSGGDHLHSGTVVGSWKVTATLP